MKPFPLHKWYFFLGLIGIIISSSCANRKLNAAKSNGQAHFSDLYEMMTGEFSSEEQAKEDSLFYNINLVMYPIWENDGNTKWLYVEQAVTKYLDKPYRQRVYKLSMQQDKTIESSVFELPGPARFVHGWQDPAIFRQIGPDSLIVRTGCAVFLKKEGDCYTGSTRDDDCKSTLRGATYATSKVSICKDQIVSWDQGWGSDDQQVWGAETRGYVFKRKTEKN